jgi:hypothetical protein
MDHFHFFHSRKPYVCYLLNPCYPAAGCSPRVGLTLDQSYLDPLDTFTITALYLTVLDPDQPVCHLLLAAASHRWKASTLQNTVIDAQCKTRVPTREGEVEIKTWSFTVSPPPVK